jgi:hypothetical protein
MTEKGNCYKGIGQPKNACWNFYPHAWRSGVHRVYSKKFQHAFHWAAYDKGCIITSTSRELCVVAWGTTSFSFDVMWTIVPLPTSDCVDFKSLHIAAMSSSVFAVLTRQDRSSTFYLVIIVNSPSGVTGKEGTLRHIWCGGPCCMTVVIVWLRYYIYIEYL